jgi:hypothetical protein
MTNPKERYEDLPHPWNHQGEGVSLFLFGSGALWFDPRLGKTRTTLEALRLAAGEGTVDRALVVGTVNAKEVWRRDFGTFCPSWDVEVLEGLHARPLAPSTRAVIINPSILEGQERRGKQFTGWIGWLLRWMGSRCALVLDESHKYAINEKAKTYGAIQKLALCAKVVWELTGTYYEKSVLDAHHQLKLLGSRYPYYWKPDQWIGERYCEKSWNRNRGRTVTKTKKDGTEYEARTGGWDYSGVRDGAEDDLMLALDGVVLRRHRHECLDVPLTRIMPYWVDHYDQDVIFRKDEMERLRSELVLLKAQRTIDYVNDLKERPLVVFGHHRKMVQHLSTHFRAPLIFGETPARRRVEIQEDFQAGNQEILVCNLAMDAVDLSRADHCVYGEIDWSATKMRQSMDRIVNGSKKRETVAHVLLVSGSVEEDVWDTILMKGNAIERLDQAARRLRELGLDMAELSS